MMRFVAYENALYDEQGELVVVFQETEDCIAVANELLRYQPELVEDETYA
jgi:hypothetical protein